MPSEISQAQTYYVKKYCVVSPFFSEMSGIDKSLVTESREMDVRDWGKEALMVIANGFKDLGGGCGDLNNNGTYRLIYLNV